MSTPEEIYQAAQSVLHEIYQAALETGDLGLIQQALEGLVSGAFGEREQTPLHSASKKGRAELVRVLLKAGADPNARDKDGRAPLHYATLWWCEQSDDITVRWRTVKLLLEAGADPNAKGDSGITPFHWAVGSTNVDIVKLYLKNGADLGATDNNGSTVFHWASKNNDAAVVQILLDNVPGADLNAKGLEDRTPLHIACENGCSDVVCFFLTHYDVDLQATDSQYQTPLHLAAYHGYVPIVELLLDKGAALEAKDDQGSTPLHWASAAGEEDVVKTLVKRGASINAQDENGSTPLDDASGLDRSPILNYLLRCYRETVAKEEGDLCLHSVLYLAKYKDVNSDAKAVLPVGTLALEQMLTLLEQWMSQFPDCIQAKDATGKLAVHVACRTASPVQVLGFLVGQYPDGVRSRDGNGATPVHVACRSQHNASIEALRFLVQQDRAVLFQIDFSGCIPLHAACASARSGGLRLEKIKFLVETGGAGTLTARNDEDWALPLHVLCESNPKVEELEFLVQQYPSALTEKTKLGDFPIMVACEHSASLSAIYTLMRADPVALMKKSDQ